MARRLFTILSAASLALAAFVLALWGASYRVTITALYADAQGVRWQVVSADGMVWMDNRPHVDADRAARDKALDEWGRRDIELFDRILTEIGHSGGGSAQVAALEQEKTAWGDRWQPVLAVLGKAKFETRFASPHWTLCAGCSALPSVWVMATLLAWWRRGRRSAAGLCPACGYDLRASPGRCPECGAEPKGATA